MYSIGQKSDSAQKTQIQRKSELPPFSAVPESESDILFLQRTVGNSGVQFFLNDSIRISHPDDASEKEADRMAETVIQRSVDSPGAAEYGSNLASEISNARSGGQSMPPILQAKMESAFNTDFSNVRIHPDADTAEKINAKAYTTGSDIFFKRGEYNPGEREGQKLLAHELTHVVQQEPFIQRETDKPEKSGKWIPATRPRSRTVLPGTPGPNIGSARPQQPQQPQWTPATKPGSRGTTGPNIGATRTQQPQQPKPAKDPRIVRFVKGIKNAPPPRSHKDAEDAREVFDKIDDYYGTPASEIGDFVSDTGEMVSSVSGVKGFEEFGSAFKKTLNLGPITSAFSTIKGGFESALGIYNSVKHLVKGESSAKEFAYETLDNLENVAETLKSTLEMVESVYSLIEPAGELLPTWLLPGIDLVIDGIGVVKHMVQTVEATINYYRAERRMSRLQQSDPTIRSMMQGAASTQQSKWYHKLPGLGSKLKKEEQRKKTKLSAETSLHTLASSSSSSNQPPASEEERMSMEKYTLMSDLRYINKKRINRGALNLSVDLMKIIGGITKLAGGEATPVSAVGTGISLLGTLTKAGAWALRKGKQFARDRGWRGTDQSKTTEAKKKQYEANVERIFNMARSLPEYDPANEDTKRQYDELDLVITLTGASLPKLLRHSGELDEQKKILIEAMKKRD